MVIAPSVPQRLLHGVRTGRAPGSRAPDSGRSWARGAASARASGGTSAAIAPTVPRGLRRGWGSCASSDCLHFCTRPLRPHGLDALRADHAESRPVGYADSECARSRRVRRRWGGGGDRRGVVE
ncbi:hypothetical protein Tchl_0936 [Thauera chlorobenzoica]|uniref:Uncharacterized protein n=1 Tax=Thauera chlorobenzoica TaxID=96773 RepID=A0A1L6FA46_9RHOO|nr:hypothetical protein Tchl_0936 [Thauera chlorobenzoica]